MMSKIILLQIYKIYWKSARLCSFLLGLDKNRLSLDMVTTFLLYIKMKMKIPPLNGVSV